MQNDLKLEVTKESGVTTVAVSGELDIFSSADFKKRIYALMENGESEFDFDCADLRYIDSTGLGVFVSILKKSKQDGCPMKLTNLNPNVRKLFRITGLDRIMDLTGGGEP